MAKHPNRMRTDEVLRWLERRGTAGNRAGLARYGITARHAVGVPVATLRQLQKQIGVDQELSLQLWQTGCYEARLLAALVGDPRQVTRRQMDAWAKDFENWADCDTACFHLFDKTSHALAMVAKWSRAKPEFVKRAAFALLASVALHDKALGDEPFLKLLPLAEREAGDERNFVKKAVSWALRGVGRRSPVLHAAAMAIARRLAVSADATERWVGKDVLRDLQKAKVRPAAKPAKRAVAARARSRAARRG